MFRRLVLFSFVAVLGACSYQQLVPRRAHATATPSLTVSEHADHGMPDGPHPREGSLARPVNAGTRSQGMGLAPGAADAAARLQASPRHNEWTMVPLSPGSTDSIAAFVVYPERKQNAPVVVVVHEIFGLSTWVRAVADQLAADGFIAIAPDLLSIERGGATTDTLPREQATALIRNVTPDKMNVMVAAVANYGMSLPAAVRKYGVVGYCWGGSASFNHAVFGAPGMSAAVVYYGSSPEAADLAKIRIPVLGLYGENDQRVNSTIARADSVLKATGGVYETHVYPGAGHGFLRGQEQPANAEAAKLAWPATVSWFRKYLQ